MRKIETHRRPLDQDRILPAGPVVFEQRRLHMQRVFIRVSHSEHPAVPRAAAHRTSNLVGQRLVRHLLVSLRQGAGQGAIGPIAPGGGAKRRNRLFEPARQEIFESAKRNQPRICQVGRLLNSITIQSVQEHRGPHSLVEVLRVPAKTFELLAQNEQFGCRMCARQIPNRAISDRRVGTRDGGDERIHSCSTLATEPINSDNIRSRSTPARARAIWASTTPNFTPRLCRVPEVSSARYFSWPASFCKAVVN